MGAKDPHGHDRRECFCNHKTQPRLDWLQVTVERARALWKQQHGVSRLQDPNHSLDGAAIDAFLIDRDHIQLWQNPAQQRQIEKRSPGQKINRPITRGASQRWIEIALVIHRENHWPTLKHPLSMNNAKPKKQSASQPA